MQFLPALSQFYQLDGWVHDHVNILLDVCNLYK